MTTSGFEPFKIDEPGVVLKVRITPGVDIYHAHVQRFVGLLVLNTPATASEVHLNIVREDWVEALYVDGAGAVTNVASAEHRPDEKHPPGSNILGKTP
jgi:hypothetical protein